MQSCFLADTYIRAWRRRELVLAAERAHLPLHIYGDGWDKLPLREHSSLIVYPSVTFIGTFSLIAQSRITLNLMPEFKTGFHDRIFSAMLNGSVAATDPSRGILREFSAGKDILLYDRMQLDEGCESLRQALEKPLMLQKIADQGRELAEKRFCWEALISGYTSL
jgi:hypothetical protein